MLYETYKIRGKHTETKRTRTIIVEAHSEDEALVKASDALLDPIASISIITPEKPTERQFEYASDLGISVPEDASKEDVSSLISRFVDGDHSDPPDSLFRYAANNNLYVSEYIGERALYNSLFNKISGKEKIAFYLYSIYCYKTQNWRESLEESEDHALFFNFAGDKVDDMRFRKSMDRYSGEDLRFFGGDDGGSIQTIAYKESVAFLQDNDLLNDENSNGNYSVGNSEYNYEKENASSDFSGVVLGIAGLSIIVLIYYFFVR